MSRELDRVVAHIDKHLPQTCGVPQDPVGESRVDCAGQRQAFGDGTCSQAAHCLGDGRPQSKLNRLNFQPARFDLGKVEHIIQDDHQGLPRRFDDGEVFPLLRLKVGAQHQICQTQHAVHGRADFVAHVGQKPAFGFARCFGQLGRFLERA